ncbi:AP2/ERF and B3 domain-containing transcription factor RAV1 [Elaeis guineensis]|uniref:AP2/ERF and B3 domain-containing transcription factor RAV1 n=1 Tax=Elaeis guineensis var. tenera TaxID=51953 RepID=UPI00057ACB12
MASLPNNLHGFSWVGVKEEEEDPGFHMSSSLRQFPTTRQEGRHAMMVASTVSNSFTRPSSSRARGVNASTSGLPTPHCNTVFQQNTTHIHRHRSSTLHPHSAIPIGPPSDDGASANTLFCLKLTCNNVQSWKCLILPTKSAERFFPDVPSLMFWDQESRRWWNFEYFRSRDRQCFQLVSGWSTFVEEKALKTGDTLIFSIFVDGDILQNSYYMIDVRRAVKLFGTVIHID